MSGETETNEETGTEETGTEETGTEETGTEETGTEETGTEETGEEESRESLRERLAAANAQAKAERNKRHEAENKHQEFLDELGIADPKQLDSYIDQRFKQNQNRAEAEQRQEQLENDFAGKLDKAKKTYKSVDFDKAFDEVGTGIGNAMGDIAPNVGNLIKASDDPWGLIAKLHSDKDAFRSLTGADSVEQAARVIGRLEASMTSNRSSKAPDPTNDLTGRSDDTDGELDENGSVEAYERAMRKQRGGSVFVR